LYGSTSSRSTSRQIRGEPVLQVEGVGDQLHPGGRRHPKGGGERLGCERRHGWGAVSAE
jgi:hypothetical protein